ncbi:hypothetical protein JXA02_14185 [candidate division KSB1 bacterium]|nr:hypothetical protein [candidate division KSB1 bacterium]
MMDEKIKATPENKVSGVDQIREIIVGDYLRDVHAELASLQKQITELRRTLSGFKEEADSLSQNLQAITVGELKKAKETVEEQQKNFETSMNNMIKTVKTQLKKLEENKVDKSKIGQVFMEWGQKINELQS